jgi:hypothetical protein
VSFVHHLLASFAAIIAAADCHALSSPCCSIDATATYSSLKETKVEAASTQSVPEKHSLIAPESNKALYFGGPHAS